jgi:hypothetical protein
MATTLIKNGATSGALGAILAGRPITAVLPADFASAADAAAAFATQFLTANAALVAPMADADNAQIGQLVQAACFGALFGRPYSSTTATDYADEANGACAAAKQAVAKLV